MKKIFMAMYLSFFIFHSLSFAESSVEWKTYDKGMEQAKIKKKQVFINFFAVWCGYCKKMDSTTFSNRQVTNYLQDNFIPIKVNTDKEPTLSQIFGVRGLPFFWFLTAKGERIAGLPGYIPPEMFLKYLEYISTKSYEKIKFNDFVK